MKKLFTIVFLLGALLTLKLNVHAQVTAPALNGNGTVIMTKGVQWQDPWVSVPAGDNVIASLYPSVSGVTLGENAVLNTSLLNEGSYTITYTITDTDNHSSSLVRHLMITDENNSQLLNSSSYQVSLASGVFRQIIAVPDGTVAVGSITNNGQSDAYAVKYNPDGSVKWTETVDLGNNEVFTSAIASSDGGVIVAGNSRSGSGQYAFIYKLVDDSTTASGVRVAWQYTVNTGSAWVIIDKLTKTSDGAYLAAGSSYPDLYLSKFEDTGSSYTVDWTETPFIQNTFETKFQAVYEVSQDTYVGVGGEGNTSQSDYNIFVNYFTVTQNSATNAYDMNILWTKTYNGSGIQGKADTDDIDSAYLNNNELIWGIHDTVSDGDYSSLPPSATQRLIVAAVKFDDSGVLSTAMKSFGGSQDVTALDFSNMPNGNFLVTADTASTDGDFAKFIPAGMNAAAYGYIIELDKNLNVVYGTALSHGTAIGTDVVCTDNSGNIYFGGSDNNADLYVGEMTGSIQVSVPDKSNSLFGLNADFNPTDQVSASDGVGNSLPVSVYKSNVDTSVYGSYQVTYEATSANLDYFFTRNVYIVSDLIPPTISIKAAYEDSPIPVKMSQTDIDWTPYFDASDNSGTVTITADLSTVNYSNPGIYSVVFTATDPSGNVATLTHDINLIDDIPPTMVLTDYTVPVYGYLSDWTSGIPTFDNCGGTVSLTADASKVNFDQVGVYPVYITATDASGNSVTETANVHVVDTFAPVIFVQGNITMNVGSTMADLEKQIQIADNYDSMASLPKTITLADGSPLTFTTAGIYDVKVSTSDSSGNIAAKFFVLHLVNTANTAFTPVHTGSIALLANDHVMPSPAVEKTLNGLLPEGTSGLFTVLLVLLLKKRSAN